MALIVEDGTGVAGAESYLDRSRLEIDCEAYGQSIPDASDENVEAALRRGTLAFEVLYSGRFLGRRYSAAQGLTFPLHDVADPRGYLLPGLPDAVITATALLARQELVSPESLFPVVKPGRSKRSFTADQVSVTYEPATGDAVTNARPILSMVEGVLARIVILPPVGGRSYYGSVFRG